MASIAEKADKCLQDSLSDNRLLTGTLALRISRAPVYIQKRFFKLAINYLEILSTYYQNRMVPMGMREICEASAEMMEVVDNYFPPENASQLVFDGMEWEQI